MYATGLLHTILGFEFHRYNSIIFIFPYVGGGALRCRKPTILLFAYSVVTAERVRHCSLSDRTSVSSNVRPARLLPHHHHSFKSVTLRVILLLGTLCAAVTRTPPSTHTCIIVIIVHRLRLLSFAEIRGQRLKQFRFDIRCSVILA